MEKKQISLNEEHLRKIKYYTGYKINESPKYHSLIGSNESFDQVPSLTNEAGEEELPKPEGTPSAPAPSAPATGAAPEPNVGTNAPEPIGGDSTPPMPSSTPQGGMPEPSMGTMPPMQPKVDDIQNEIIRHNIEAMKSIQNELESLNSMTSKLNQQLQQLNADVEEVREPTNTEKLMSKKDVSYPYYFNLNDMWSNNWFTENRKNNNEKGIRELPDGTYIADFDDLPQSSKLDIDKSFNDIV